MRPREVEEVTLTIKVKIRHNSVKERNSVLRQICKSLGMNIVQFGIHGYASAKTGAVRVQKESKDKA